MITESFGQIVDRMVIEQLKAFMHTDPEKKQQCEDQASLLQTAADAYLYECATGTRKPHVNHSARYHDHKTHDIEHVTLYADTVGEAILGLSKQHFDYWQLQSRIQEIKGKLDDEKYASTHTELSVEFVDLQRKIDMCNQNRNDIRDRLDKILVELFSRKES
tara:strand:+ start:138 stop:623 length:486 start_codon:yes stop_codon:yes gene_type:complete